ncbi:hypothetical protein ASPTUDRAFT_69743 [Aspergillus tubingensis CBS 134.48]|uniref:RRM domain-containing protein n=1 Tax=Aspergillus tubingensis (strain CBS 134.48) TaxID=767770 RepID=A0A1L9MS24_ASPTC|nr:hypothetical protein ASPTUDRAFT_69743 [Aspergillus tubingensis CBS 134.48]
MAEPREPEGGDIYSEKERRASQALTKLASVFKQVTWPVGSLSHTTYQTLWDCSFVFLAMWALWGWLHRRTFACREAKGQNYIGVDASLKYRMMQIDKKIDALDDLDPSVFDTENVLPSLEYLYSPSCKLIIRGLECGVTVEDLMGWLEPYKPVRGEVHNDDKGVVTFSNWCKSGIGSVIRAMHHQRKWIPPRLTGTPIKIELQILQSGIRETVFVATTDADQMSSHICTTGRYRLSEPNGAEDKGPFWHLFKAS